MNFATMIGNFNDGTAAGKFNGVLLVVPRPERWHDKQINALSNMGLLVSSSAC
jgi:hypothetical protein